MNPDPSPLRLAAQSFLVCLACCGLVLLLDHGAALREPIRLGIMLFILVAVPAGNFFGHRWRRRNAG